MSKRRSAARALVEVLMAQGVTRVFCVPGESYLPVLDALHDVKDRIDTIVCRHEAAAANMAEAHGKLTGRPGIAFVTRGPGACHAAIGIHTAQQDSTPMILFIGQVARADRGREAFQEVDYRAFFGSMTKWADEIDDADRIPELIERAFHVSMQGRAGPVALALPEDMLTEMTEAGIGAAVMPARAAPDAAAIAELETLLKSAERPMLLLGGAGWTQDGAKALAQFVEAADMPTALSFRRKHLLDNESPHYVGDLGLGPNPKLVERLRQSDLVIALGARIGENPSQGYTLFTREETAAKLVHIHPGVNEIGRVWPARLGLVADPNLAAQALAARKINPRWDDWRARARADYEAFSSPADVKSAVNLARICAHLNEALSPNAIIANDAGNFAIWLHRYYRHRQFATQLGPTSGAMGYGLPAAIAAKLEHPGRDVIAIIGDGGFMMNGNELATAMRHGVNVVILVIDNSSFGTIRMHQERHYPARTHATDLANPDFVAYAEAFGAFAARVERTADFPAALAAARAAGKPALVHIVTEVEDIAPGVTVSALRGRA